jgi:hypothetical protein
MNRTLGVIALAAAGIGFLLYTDRGKALKARAGEALQDGYEQIGDAVARRRGVEGMVKKALDQPHPDTAVAAAFEEAAA